MIADAEISLAQSHSRVLCGMEAFVNIKPVLFFLANPRSLLLTPIDAM